MPVFLGRVSNFAPYFKSVAYSHTFAKWNLQKGATGAPKQEHGVEINMLLSDTEFAASFDNVRTFMTT